MNENDTDDQPTIDMTSQEDQAFMDAEADPNNFDPVEHYERLVEEFEEKGWDTSVLKPPEEDKDGNKQ
jgi:hypothetical protein